MNIKPNKKLNNIIYLISIKKKLNKFYILYFILLLVLILWN